ncbi:MAG TPA: type II toxin-antitoxin system VapC family toxin [Terracidiphilus sp.]
MKVLLDTCVVIWATLSPSVLSREAREAIADEGNVVLVSAASACEIATKVRLGRLRGAEKLERNYIDVMEDAGYTLLAIDTASALRAGRLAADNRDPFDRMIVAQALGLDIPVVSPDIQFDGFGMRRIW